MAPISSQHIAGRDTHSSYLVIFKIHGDAIRLFEGSIHAQYQHHQLAAQNISPVNAKGQRIHHMQPSFRISCTDVESRRLVEGTNETGHANDVEKVQIFVLDKAATLTDRSVFMEQPEHGQELNQTDLALFMTPPIESSRKAYYAIDIRFQPPDHQSNNSMEDLRNSEQQSDSNNDSSLPLGSAFIYVDPKFSTQGLQRMQIVSNQQVALGQLQVEYLVVTNPLGYGIKVPRPEWLSRAGTHLHAGHRGSGSGCRGDLPKGLTIMENTVASFNYAARHGADMCELDVMCTADGVPVVYHNYTLNTKHLNTGGVAMQIDQLTLEQLRTLSHYSIHDENCKHEEREDTRNQLQLPPRSTDCQAFPTLEQVLRDVDKTCALNIELKWAQMLPNGKSEALHYREINDFVDRILKCIFQHGNGRPIFLSTFNADVAILMRLKQTTYPVLFLTTGDAQRFNDPTTKTVKNAIHFAQAFGMAGINPNVAHLNEYLVRYAQDRGLLVYAWGDIKSPQAVKELKSIGLNGIIYDKIDLIKPQD